MKLIHYDIRIAGHVQGVAFRKYTFDKAQSMNITGYVKNEANGDVTIEAEADEKILTDFVNWCYQGSPYSKVLSVKTTKGSLKSFRTFEILF